MQWSSFAGMQSGGVGLETGATAHASAVAEAGLAEAGWLVQAGLYAAASRRLQILERTAWDRQEFFLLRAQCQRALGQIDEAARSFRWAQRIGPDAGAIGAQLAALAGQQKARTAACRSRRRLHGFQVVRFLGAGWEGAVYHCRDERGRNYVLKQFHDNRIDLINRATDWHRQPVIGPRTSIMNLGQALRRTPHPVFFGYQSIVRRGRLEALYYPYRRLHTIGHADLQSAALRRTLIRAALSGQAHLMEIAGMMMVDLRVGQFLLDQRARVRYVDYGSSILPLDDFRIREDLRHVQALILLLVEVFAWDEWQDFERLELIAEAPDELQRRVDQSPGLQRCLQALPALQPFLRPGAILDPVPLADPAVYRAAAAAISARRPWRVLSRGVAWELRREVRRIRRRLKL